MRLIVAVPLPPHIREHLVRIQGGIAKARWVTPENLHVTLRFIGEADGGQARDLDAELSAIRFAPFELTFDGLGVFERKRRVHTLWAGLAPSQDLAALRERVEAAAVRAGFGPEGRKFKPHATLARFGSGLKAGGGGEVGAYLQTHGTFTTGAFPVERFHLYESRLGHGGSRYEVMAEYAAD